MVNRWGFVGTAPIFHYAHGTEMLLKSLPIDVFSQKVRRIQGAHNLVEWVGFQFELFLNP